MSGCPSEEQLGRLLTEQVSGSDRQSLEGHVEYCTRCQDTLERLTEDTGLWGRWQAGSAQKEAVPEAEFLNVLKRFPPHRKSPDNSPGTRDPASNAPAQNAWSMVPGYEIIAELGRGGMGVVYKARQAKLKRMVAIKMLLEGVHAGPEQIGRIRTEAESVARLQHPNVVQIYEVGEVSGLPYLSFEFVEGTSLAQKIAGTPVPMRRAAELIESLARAVHFAHQHGIVHRDLKPSNVLLTVDDTPKITDFGLSKHLGADVGHTKSGSIMGTPSYMSPEQAKGMAREIGSAADVYALGAILYELLTGRPPFRGESPSETLHQVIWEEPVAPRGHRPKLPKDLETICLKCLQKRPDRRYTTAEELADDLRHFLDEEPIRARPIGVFERTIKWTKRRPAAAALMAVSLTAVLSLFGIGLWYNSQLREQLVRMTVSSGTQYLKEGDSATALLYFCEALRLDRGESDRVRIQRTRIGSVLAQCPKLVRFWSHEKTVNWAEFSSDGRYVVSASDDGTVKLWDVTTGDQVWTFGHRGPVRHASFSPDGSRVATASADGTAQILNATTGKPITSVLEHEGPVNHASFSPSGSFVVTASDDKTARLWDATTGNPVGQTMPHKDIVFGASLSSDGSCLVTWTGQQDRTARLWDSTGQPIGGDTKLLHGNDVTHACFSRDGRRLVTTSTDNSAYLWDSMNGQLIARLKHGETVNHAALSPDGKRLLTASFDGTARLWDVNDTDWPMLTITPGSPVHYACFGPEGSRRIATACRDGTVRIWDTATGEPLCPPLRHNGIVVRAFFGPDGSALLTASQDGSVRIWDVVRTQLLLSLEHAGRVDSAAFSHDGKRVVTASHDRTARVWDSTTGKLLIPPLLHKAEVYYASFSPDGELLITSSGDRSAQILDSSTGKHLRSLQHADQVRHAEFSPNGLWVVTASDDNTAQVWRTDTGEAVGPSLKHSDDVSHASFSPDGHLVITASGDRTAGMWDAVTGKLMVSFRHAGPVRHASFSPDGRWVVTASADGTARVWDAKTGAPVTDPLDHEGAVEHASFSPNGAWVLTTSASSAHVWDARTGKPMGQPMKHVGNVHYASFSPDGRLVVTASVDRTARVWDGATGQPVTTPLKHLGIVYYASFSPDGDRVLTASQDGTAAIWELPYDVRETSDLRHQAEVLSGRRLEPGGALVSLPTTALKQTWVELRGKSPHEFNRSQSEAMMWHLTQTRVSKFAKDWSAVGFHVGKATENGAKDPNILYEHALLRLQANDQAGYRTSCVTMLELFAKTNDWDTANTVAWTCVLLPDSVADLTTVVRLAEWAVDQADRADAARTNAALNTLGVALYRAGRFDDAVQRLTEAVKVNGGRASIWDSLFLAMAYSRLGRSEAARLHFGKATNRLDGQTLEERLSRLESSPTLSWREMIELRNLLCEADSLINHSSR